MYRLLFAVAFLVFLSGCRIETDRNERSLERAEERLEEAREEAADRLEEARRDASRELERASEEAERRLEKAREQLQAARERLDDASEEVERGSERWSREARREAEDALEDVGVAESIGQVLEDVGKALQNEDGVEAVSPSRLRDFLPDEIEGMERYNTDSDEAGRWGISVSHAKAKYRNDDGDRLSVVVADLGTLRGLLARSEDLLDSSITRREDRDYSRTTRINGYPARIARDRDGRSDEFDGVLIVENRFVVVMEARGDFDDDIFEDVFDAIPTRRLARLAN
ncbi:MAG: hypothetical protein HKN29_13910 [Rhodothermales bacterium]|nr:hypothetical protein [Rhodothermales bacterium]